MRKRNRKWDLLLVGGLVLLGLLGFGLSLLMQSEGAQVIVTVEGEEVCRLSLQEDAHWLIESQDGENLLVIENGQARVEYADCPTQVCVHTPPVSLEGEVIVCLPHQVVITIETEE